ncbi:MAG TPA: tetratricopeptide repeat protein, partial [Polyangia bacterium]|nr:tetratricopeptide repeat protein [Polyangia bacterium]
MSATQNPPPPIDFESLLWRTGELLRAGDADRAAVTIQEALQLKPRDSKARSLLGLVYFKIGKQSEARALYRELAAEFPDDAGIHLNLGLVELKVGAWEAAIEALEAALRLDPQNERAKQYLDLARRVRAQAGAAM